MTPPTGRNGGAGHRVHFITYGNNAYRNSKSRLGKQAENTGWFNTVNLYGPEDLDSTFRETFRDILSAERGGLLDMEALYRQQAPE